MDNLWIVILASMLSGLIGVFVTLAVQKYTAKRNEQMLLFKTLMALRSMGASYEKTRALNLIDVVFYGVDSVIIAWRNLYDAYSPKNNNPEDIRDKTLKMLETMAKHLNYKDLDWVIIKNDYLPTGIYQDMQGEAEYKEGQLEFLRTLNSSQFKDLIKHFMPPATFEQEQK